MAAAEDSLLMQLPLPHRTMLRVECLWAWAVLEDQENARVCSSSLECKIRTSSPEQWFQAGAHIDQWPCLAQACLDSGCLRISN